MRVFSGMTITGPHSATARRTASYKARIKRSLPRKWCARSLRPQLCDWLRLAKRRRQRGQVHTYRFFHSISTPSPEPTAFFSKWTR